MSGPAAVRVCGLLATSLFGDLPGGLYEDASARLREHPALIRVLSLAPGRRPGGHLDLPAADKELPGWPTRSRNVTALSWAILVRKSVAGIALASSATCGWRACWRLGDRVRGVWQRFQYSSLMGVMSRRQATVLEELEEWREDVCGHGIGSRVVLVAAPAGWGRSAVLARFLDGAGSADGLVALVARIDGNEPGERAVQATTLQKKLAAVAPRSRAAELLDVDTPAGVAGLGFDVASWFVPGLAAAVSLTGLSRLFGAAVRAWDDSPAGEAGAVARAARAVAALSVKVPVVVVLDDADLLDPGLARAVIGGLAGRYDGQVLVVAAARPGSDLAAGLLKDPGPELAGRVCRAEAEPRMDYSDRAELAGELLPGLAVQAAERIGRRTATFGEVFAATSAELLAGLAPGTEAAEAVAAADAVLDAVLERAVPSREAAVLAWAGGALHQAQADACLEVLGAERAGQDVHVRRAGRLACLADPASRRCAEQAAAFSPRQRAALAAAVLEAAGRVAADSDAGLADRVVARQAVHRVRADLGPALRGGLPGVQRRWSAAWRRSATRRPRCWSPARR